MQSCIYEGTVWHRRRTPVEHRFGYRLMMHYLDLAEVPELLGGPLPLYSAKFSPGSFRRSDHLGSTGVPLDEAVRDLVEEQSGKRPRGSVRLLTLLRHWGYYFSPLNLYYCFDAAGECVENVVAEVSNTPWLERHYYVLHEGNRRAAEHHEERGRFMRHEHAKQFHVSPFMDMDFSYAWRFNRPGSSLKVHLQNRKHGQPYFDAALVLHRRELTPGRLRRCWLGYPWMTAQVVAAIHFEAFRLWWKQCPFHPHPKHLGTSAAG
jgi:hypothetical protein